MTLNCIIVDDEPMARKLLQEYIEETDFLKLSGVAENPLKAIPLLASPEIDLMFLDVNMPKMSGMDFLRSSPNLPMVIMTTAYTQYALEGFEMAVIDYLVKPFPLERFIAAAMKALDLKTLRTQSNKKGQDNAEYFYIKSNGRIERILYGDLLYIEAMSNYVTLYTVQTKFTAYLTVKGILEKLPPDRFVQVHKSTIVNIDHIRSIDGNLLHIGDNKITISANFQTEAMDRILKDRYIKR